MKLLRQLTALMVGCFSLKPAHGQCNNNLYGISAGLTNEIFSVNTTTGLLTAVSGSITSSTTAHPNALGYAGGATPTFYFFANSNTGSLVFESFVPGAVAPTGTFNTLATPSFSGITVGTINSGTIAPFYQGYYCLDTHGYLYYYTISTNSWTLVTQVIKDQTGTDITATVGTYSSGDMAFDGNGNLWLLLANQSVSPAQYGLYEIYGSVPTTTVSSVTARKVVALGATMPDGYDPVGIAFNASGQMYISTINTATSPQSPGHLFLWSSTSTQPAYIPNATTPATMGAASNYVIMDMASCSMPVTILPVHFEQVTATRTAQGPVTVRWQVAQELQVQAYHVERSQDGLGWQSMGSVAAGGSSLQTSYLLQDAHPLAGNSYYRVMEVDQDGTTLLSSVARVQRGDNPYVRLWPNPAIAVLYVENPLPTPLEVSLFDAQGRAVLTTKLPPGISQLSLAALPPGLFVLRAARGMMSQPLVKARP